MPDIASSESADAVLAADQRRREALVANDFETLTRLMDRNIAYTHASGRTDHGLAAHPDRLQKGEVRFTKAELRNGEVRQHGSVAWMTGETTLDSTWRDGRKQTANLLFLSVWVEEKGTWRMVAWHSTRMVPPS